MFLVCVYRSFNRCVLSIYFWVFSRCVHWLYLTCNCFSWCVQWAAGCSPVKACLQSFPSLSLIFFQLPSSLRLPPLSSSSSLTEMTSDTDTLWHTPERHTRQTASSMWPQQSHVHAIRQVSRKVWKKWAGTTNVDSHSWCQPWAQTRGTNPLSVQVKRETWWGHLVGGAMTLLWRQPSSLSCCPGYTWRHHTGWIRSVCWHLSLKQFLKSVRWFYYLHSTQTYTNVLYFDSLSVFWLFSTQGWAVE